MRTGRSMHSARVITAAASLAVAGCAGGTAMQEHAPPAHHAQHHAQSMTDTRRQVPLTPAERDAVLVEMRTMLGSVSGVLHGLSANDWDAMETAARASGTVMAVDPHLKAKLPPQFLDLGMQTHKKFDALANLITTRPAADAVVRSLADVTTNCVACHAMYRF